MSNTITAATLAKQGGPEQQADYLRHFRADSIGKTQLFCLGWYLEVAAAADHCHSQGLRGNSQSSYEGLPGK